MSSWLNHHSIGKPRENGSLWLAKNGLQQLLRFSPGISANYFFKCAAPPLAGMVSSQSVE